MTHHVDILGRAPVMRPMTDVESVAELPAGDDWKGERFLRVQRSVDGGGGGYNMKSRMVGAAYDRFKRRDRVKQLHGQGMTATDIAATVGCSHTCVVSDLKLAGLK